MDWRLTNQRCMAWIGGWQTQLQPNGRLIHKLHCKYISDKWYLISMRPHVFQRTTNCVSINVCSRVLTRWCPMNTKSIPWTGPWKVLHRGPKTYTIDLKDKTYTVSTDRLQSVYMLSDFATAEPRFRHRKDDNPCHDGSPVRRSWNIMASAAHMSHASSLSVAPQSDVIRQPPAVSSWPPQGHHTHTCSERRSDCYNLWTSLAVLPCTYCIGHCCFFVISVCVFLFTFLEELSFLPSGCSTNQHIPSKEKVYLQWWLRHSGSSAGLSQMHSKNSKNSRKIFYMKNP